MRILRILQSHSMPCGCFVGIYETYEGRTVTIVEEPAATCRHPSHREGREIVELPDSWLREAAPQ